MKPQDFILPAVVILLFGSACFCFDDAGDEPQSSRAPSVTDPPTTVAPSEMGSDGPFVVANPKVTSEQLPARFEAGLPTTLEGFEDRDSYPPLSQFEGRLCRGAPDARKKFIAAVTRAAEDGTLEEELSQRYRRMLRFCDSSSLCPWLEKQVTSDMPGEAKSVFWYGLSSCKDPSVLDAFDDPGAPGRALVDWYSSQYGSSALPAHPRLESVLLEQVTSGDERDARTASMMLRRLEPDRAVELAKTLRENLETPERKAFVGIGLSSFDDHAEAKRLFEESCAELPEEPICGEPSVPEAPRGQTAPEERTLVERAKAYDFEPTAYLEKHPERQSKLEGIYRACVHSSNERVYARQRCLSRLASIDRDAATKAARGQIDERGGLGELSRTLVAFPGNAALVTRVRKWGLIPDEAEVKTDGDSPSVLTVEDVLIQRDRVHSFDTETGMFPNAHDALLATLAQMAGDDLSGMYFVEDPPNPDVHGYDGGVYTLHAYADSQKYTVHAQNMGDWYDVETVLGLLNALLDERDSDLRYAALSTGDQTSRVVVAPRDGLLAANELGVLTLGSGSEGAAAGKEFEKRVLEQLQKEGKDVVFEPVVDEDGNLR